jgi:acetyltransferase-like isoleucine patch superfamily enzyme
MTTEFTLSGADLAAFDARGVRLAGLRHTGRLTPASRIEAPTSLLSTVTAGAFIDIGAFCNLSGGTINNVRFGRYCSVAAGVVIGMHEHPTDWLTSSRTAYYPRVNGWDALMSADGPESIHARKRPFTASCPVTTIGPDVWIGQGAFLKSGVTIGAGAIIGARALVMRDVPPYAVVVGTPAKVVRLRFPEPLVERLLALEWWRYNIYDLFDAPFDDVPRALDVIEGKIAEGAVAPFTGTEITPTDLASPKTTLARLPAAPLSKAS